MLKIIRNQFYLKIYQYHLINTQPNIYQDDKFEIKLINGKNSDIYELRLYYDSKQIASSAVVNGFRNIQNLVRKLKPVESNGKSSITTARANPLAARRRARMANKTSALSGDVEIADASKCDYVEIMACPNGCINGGGQIMPPDKTQEKEWLNEVMAKYNSISMFDLPSEHRDDMEMLVKWSNEVLDCGEDGHDRVYKTYFNEVEKPTDPNAVLLGAKW